MVRMFVRHRVGNYPAWRKVYDAFDSQRPSFGVTGQAVYQDAGDSNMVTVTHDFAGLADAERLASSDALKEAMQAAGVVGAPQIWFTTKM
jgi:hypothetical protein